MTEPRDIEVLEALFVGDEVDGASIARAAGAACEDGELRGLFNRLALADREVGGDFEASIGEAWFLDSLDEMLAEEVAEPVADVVSLADRRVRAPVWMAAAAVIATGFAAVAYDQLRDPEPEFQPRSVTEPSTTEYQLPAVAAFCVDRSGDEVKFVGAEQSEFATVRCALGAELKLAVRNPDSRLRYGAFIGISNDDSVYWYGPSPAEQDAITVPTTQELAPIGETIRLGVNHKAGSVRLIALFTEEPMKWGPLTGWINEHHGKLRDGDLEVLGGVVVRQTFEVTP